MNENYITLELKYYYFNGEMNHQEFVDYMINKWDHCPLYLVIDNPNDPYKVAIIRPDNIIGEYSNFEYSIEDNKVMIQFKLNQSIMAETVRKDPNNFIITLRGLCKMKEGFDNEIQLERITGFVLKDRYYDYDRYEITKKENLYEPKN